MASTVNYYSQTASKTVPFFDLRPGSDDRRLIEIPNFTVNGAPVLINDRQIREGREGYWTKHRYQITTHSSDYLLVASAASDERTWDLPKVIPGRIKRAVVQYSLTNGSTTTTPAIRHPFHRIGIKVGNENLNYIGHRWLTLLQNMWIDKSTEVLITKSGAEAGFTTNMAGDTLAVGATETRSIDITSIFPLDMFKEESSATLTLRWEFAAVADAATYVS